MSDRHDDHRPSEPDLRLEQLRKEAEMKALAEQLQKKTARE